MSKQKIIGYWKENNNIYYINNKEYEFYKNLKLPIENSAKENQVEIIKLLEQKQKDIDTGTDIDSDIDIYFGDSICRICNKKNGCCEYYDEYYRWPGGYIHYLKEHNVAIDDEFKKYLLESKLN
jgi:hypothetical protein